MEYLTIRMPFHRWTAAIGVPLKSAATLAVVRKGMIALAGASVLAIGVALLILPGPAFVVIPAGLAILGIEFAWARRWLSHAKQYGDRATRSWTAWRSGS